MGVARGSGNRPEAPPPLASRLPVRLPGEHKLFFQKLRGSERTVCAPQGQVGKWSRRRRGEEAKGGERGAPLPRQVPTLGSCPSVFNPLWRRGRTSQGKGIPRGQTPLGPGPAASQPPTHHHVPHPPEMRGRAGCQEAPGREEGAISPRGTLCGPPLLSRGRPQPQVFPARDGSFHLLGVGEEGRAPSPPDPRAPSPPLLPALSAHFWL